MLRYIWRLPLMLCLTFSALIGSAVMVGRAQPELEIFNELGIRWCGDRLCMMGIKPGETLRESLLLPSYVKIIETWEVYTADFGQFRLFIEDTPLESGQVVINGITVSMPDLPDKAPLPIGDFIRRYGPPCSLYFEGNGFSQLLYHGFSISVRTQGTRMMMDDPIELLVWYVPPPNDDPCVGFAWEGFKPYPIVDWE